MLPLLLMSHMYGVSYAQQRDHTFRNTFTPHETCTMLYSLPTAAGCYHLHSQSQMSK